MTENARSNIKRNSLHGLKMGQRDRQIGLVKASMTESGKVCDCTWNYSKNTTGATSSSCKPEWEFNSRTREFQQYQIYQMFFIICLSFTITTTKDQFSHLVEFCIQIIGGGGVWLGEAKSCIAVTESEKCSLALLFSIIQECKLGGGWNQCRMSQLTELITTLYMEL